MTTNFQKRRREGVRGRQCQLNTANVPELAQTPPETGTGSIEAVESLRGVESRAGKGYRVTHLVEIVNEPHQFILIKIQHGLLERFAVEDVAEFIMELGRRPVQLTELLQGHGSSRYGRNKVRCGGGIR